MPITRPKSHLLANAYFESNNNNIIIIIISETVSHLFERALWVVLLHSSLLRLNSLSTLQPGVLILITSYQAFISAPHLIVPYSCNILVLHTVVSDLISTCHFLRDQSRPLISSYATILIYNYILSHLSYDLHLNCCMYVSLVVNSFLPNIQLHVIMQV